MTHPQAFAVLGFAVALAATSCRRVEEPAGDTADDAGAKQETQALWSPYKIASQVLEGCRGPADLGCEACARPASPYSCLICHQWGPEMPGSIARENRRYAVIEMTQPARPNSRSQRCWRTELDQRRRRGEP